MFPLRAVADDHLIAIAREQASLVAANEEVHHELAERLSGLRANPLVLEAQLPEHPLDTLSNPDEKVRNW